MTSLGLTEKELNEVYKTWDMVKKNLREHGIQILMVLFTKHPEYKDKFQRFQDVSVEELPVTATMRAHASAFMHGISLFLDNLEDKETLLQLIHDNAERHFGRGIRFPQYKTVLGLLPGYLQEKLGANLTEEGANGWQKVVDIMVSVFSDEIDKLQIKNGGSSVDSGVATAKIGSSVA